MSRLSKFADRDGGSGNVLVRSDSRAYVHDCKSAERESCSGKRLRARPVLLCFHVRPITASISTLNAGAISRVTLWISTQTRSGLKCLQFPRAEYTWALATPQIQFGTHSAQVSLSSFATTRKTFGDPATWTSAGTSHATREPYT